mmetsp:Transcript_8060/g.29306  ORF Transcript_8060/g.29306 Transcript_8060/m.29306 type:complete len:671 (+) Transcript_8060:1040-3052(+)
MLHLLLLLNQALEVLHIGQTGVRRHERFSLLAAVGEPRVENGAKQLQVLLGGPRVAALSETRRWRRLRLRRSAVQPGPECGGASPRTDLLVDLLGRNFGQVEGIQVEVDALGRPLETKAGKTHGLHRGCRSRTKTGGRQSNALVPQRAHARRAHAGRWRWRTRPGPWHNGLAQRKLPQTHLHAAVDAAELGRQLLLLEATIFEADLGVASLVPELGHGQHAGGHLLVGQREPSPIHQDLGIKEELRQHRCLRQLPEVEDHAFPLSDQIEVLCEGLRIADQWVTWPRNRGILQTITAPDLLPGLHTHLDIWDQSVALRQVDRGLAHHEPLARVPLLAVARGPAHDEVVGASHAEHRLLELAHRKLFQVVIGLKHDLADARAREPGRLEALRLHPSIALGGADEGAHLVGVVDRVQRKHRLPVLSKPDLHGQREVCKVDGLGRLGCGHGPHSSRLGIEHQAVHPVAPGRALDPELGEQARAVRRALGPPADAILEAFGLLEAGLLPQAVLVLGLKSVHHALRNALAMHQLRGFRGAARVSKLGQRQPALAAQRQLFPIGVCVKFRVRRMAVARSAGPPLRGSAARLGCGERPLHVRAVLRKHRHLSVPLWRRPVHFSVHVVRWLILIRLRLLAGANRSLHLILAAREDQLLTLSCTHPDPINISSIASVCDP